MIADILQDIIFAALAALGFASISRPPRRALWLCCVTAAAGHVSRFFIMNPEFGISMHIIPATLIASLIIGLIAVFMSPVVKIPAETCLFPALLPMVPGIYAYKAFGGMAMCLMTKVQADFYFYFYQFMFNGFTCLCILMCMAIGATFPVFLFENISFQATRRSKYL